MNIDNKPGAVDTSNDVVKKSGYSKASLILAAAPIAILLLGFLFCMIVSASGGSDNDLGAAWWLFIALILILVPVLPIANILSVIFGVIGLKGKKTVFAWAGIAIVSFEVLAGLLIFGAVTVAGMPAKNARNREILELREEILNYETYADLTPFGLGLYKLRREGDRFLWDVTQPKERLTEYDGVDMVYENHFNRRSDKTWDNAWGNSNEGKDVMYDVIFYEGTYIIITPLWDKPGGLYYWGYIYLCKDLKEDVDLFDIGILDPKVVDKLRELPVEQISRMKLAEMLGKEY